MNAIDAVLTSAAAPGIYRLLSQAGVVAMARAVTARGWRFFYLDGRRARDKAGFLTAAAAAMAFPAYYGQNWDAFEECITDLAWAPAPGYVLLYDHVWCFACHPAGEWPVARSILAETSRVWANRAAPFYTLLRNTHGCAGVPGLLTSSRA